MIVHVLEVEVIEDRGLLEEAGELLAVVIQSSDHQIIAEVLARTWCMTWISVVRARHPRPASIACTSIFSIGNQPKRLKCYLL